MNLAGKQFLIRMGIFIVFFFLISILHPYVVSYFHGYFVNTVNWWLFIIIIPLAGMLTYFRWVKLTSLRPYRNSILQTVMFLLLAGFLYYAPISMELLKDTTGILINYYGLLFVAHLFLFLAIFNLNIGLFFYKELLLLIAAVVAYLFMNVGIYNYGMYISSFSVWIMSVFLPLIFSKVEANVVTRNLTVDGFSVIVGPNCSGVQSIMTFAFLYFISLMLVKKYRNIKCVKAVVFFVIVILFMFLLNIVRISTIIGIGAYISKDMAIKLFHEYLGAVLVLLILVGHVKYLLPRLVVNKK